MKKNLFRGLLVLAIALLIGALWYASRHTGRAPEQPATASESPPAAPAPTTQSALPISPAPSPPPSEPPTAQLTQDAEPPPLDVPKDATQANELVVRLLMELVGRKTVREFLQLDGLADRIVATVDSLARSHSSWTIWPVNRTGERFTVVPSVLENEGTLSATNAARYTGFVHMVESVETDKWISLYIRIYPLLQDAYARLGYPDASFNARLLEVIDHLLATPVLTTAPGLRLVEVRGPVASVQPWLRYEYQDPALEAMSAGQKMLMRMGAANHQRLRIKLTALRVALAVRASDFKPKSPP